MDPTKRNYIIDILLGLDFLVVLATGIIQFLSLHDIFGIRSWGLPFNTILTVHVWSGMVLLVLIVAHIAVHWQWVANVTRMMFAKK
jgi:hypothetical protein